MHFDFEVDESRLKDKTYQLEVCQKFFDTSLQRTDEDDDELSEEDKEYMLSCEWWLHEGFGQDSWETKNGYFLSSVETTGIDRDGSEVTEVWALLKDDSVSEKFHNVSLREHAVCYVSCGGYHSSWGASSLDTEHLNLVKPNEVKYIAWKQVKV